MSLQWTKGSKGDAIALDDSHFPVLISTWFGSPTEALVNSFYAWLHEQLQRGRREAKKFVLVADSGPAGVPSAEVRRLIADQTLTWEKAGAREQQLGSFTVIESAVMRGVVNTLSWLHGDLRTEIVATPTQAVTRALQLLAEHRIPTPTTLVASSYQRPLPPR